ncbi:MAG: choice-of-anchor L domain-containing protein, partial [Crocinitomicaceae bacterium]
MKTSTKLLSMFSAFCGVILLGMSANAQVITVTPGQTAIQMAQQLVGSNVTVSNATYTGATNASGSFTQGTSTFPLADGIILTSGTAANAIGPNNSTGSSTSNGTAGDIILNGLTGGITTFDAAVLEFDITSNCNTVTFDYIFASEEYLEYGCSNFNDAFGFFISGPGFAPNTNIALVPGTSIPVSINNVINSPGTSCVSNPTYYVDNAAGTSIQYDGRTVVMTATATIQPCQTYHVKIIVADAGDSALDSAIFLKGGGINCTSPGVATNAVITPITCGGVGAIDLSVNSGTGPFTYSWTGPNGFTATTEDISGLAVGDYTVDITGSDCLSSGQET